MSKGAKRGGKLKWIIIAVIVIAVIGAASGGGDDGDKDQNLKSASSSNVESKSDEKNDSEEEEVPIEYLSVTATELSDALESNALKAQNDYKDKYIEVTGTLGTIDSSGKYIDINSDKDFDMTIIQCYLKTDEQKEIIMNKTKGDSIKVKGYCKEVGELLGYSIDIDSIE